MIDYFGLDAELPPLEAALERTGGVPHAGVLATLAWYLRQRDAGRAAALARQALDPQEHADAAALHGVAGRAHLTLAQVHLVRSQRDEAARELALARQGFAAAGDAVGAADGLMAEGLLAMSCGNPARRRQCHQEAAAAYGQAGDELRQRIAAAYAALSATDPADAGIDWDEAFAAARRIDHAGLWSVLLQARGWHHYLHGELASSTRAMIGACEHAVASGQIRGAVVMMGNIGANYAALGALADALEWAERGLALARRAGGTVETGHSLAQAGHVLLLMRRFDAARALFDEGLAQLGGDRASPDHVALQCYLGNLLNEQGDFAQALLHHGAAAERAHALGYPTHAEAALCGKGRALGRLGRAGEAVATMQEVLASARSRGAVDVQVEALQSLARLAGDGATVPDAAGTSRLTSLELLQQALAAAQGDPAYAVPHEVHAALSVEHERAGDLRAALQSERQARVALEASHNKRAADLALAMQIRYDTERVEAEARADRQRARNLEQDKLALERETQRLSRESQEDALTGVANRRRLDAELQALGNARTSDKTLCIALLDIDHFKRINDRFSHQLGDEVLRRIGAILQRQCRTSDLVARYGGEEFALLLRDAPLAAAATMCERVREAIASHPWRELHPDLAVTASIGLACRTERAVPNEWVGLADARLYRAKHAGRNRVVWDDVGRE